MSLDPTYVISSLPFGGHHCLTFSSEYSAGPSSVKPLDKISLAFDESLSWSLRILSPSRHFHPLRHSLTSTSLHGRPIFFHHHHYHQVLPRQCYKEVHLNVSFRHTLGASTPLLKHHFDSASSPSVSLLSSQDWCSTKWLGRQDVALGYPKKIMH